MSVTLTFASGRYDRVAALFDGRVSIPDVTLRHVALSPEELFPRAIRGGEFDIFELSCGAYLIRRSQGLSDIVGLPIFLSRSFRHSGIYIRTDRGIATPEGLRGRVLGVPDYWMTGAIWMRGLLSDEYGVQPDEVAWRTGGLNRPRIPALTAASLPPSLQVEEISPHDTLSEQLRRGDLDGILTSDVPDSFRQKAPHVDRLFPNYRVAEQDYARRTGLHPIMHLLAVRRRVLKDRPKLASQLTQALTAARDLALADLSELSAIHMTLPWATSYAAEAQDVLGSKFWPYGLDANQAELETLIRYAFEQKLIPRRPAIGEFLHDEPT
jgi:4,5-dihydroxyphthalate decarboxylase